MRIPPGARVYLTTVISLAGVALATWFGMQAGAAVPGRRWWTLGAVAVGRMSIVRERQRDGGKPFADRFDQDA